jgi:uncharacterized membrane-anchored protein YitT (DUF2179 family)
VGDIGLRLKVLLAYLSITIGSLVTALGLVLFLVPHRIAAGGVSGLATIIFYKYHFPVGVTMLVLNVPLFLVTTRLIGAHFGMRTLYGAVTLSIFIELLTPWVTAPTQDPLLASVYGGILVGTGLGLVFRAQGTTGGTDLVAQLLNHYFKITMGQALLISDGVVIMLAGLTFNIELALYALISLFVNTRVIDVVQEGVGYAKAALVISDHSEQIVQTILAQLNRGATFLKGRGVYTGEDREVILCVVTRAEVGRLKALVSEIDPAAFVIVANIHEVLGEGFKNVAG